MPNILLEIKKMSNFATLKVLRLMPYAYLIATQLRKVP